MGFTLEENTLSDVEKKLGRSTPGACSKETDASKMLCYISEAEGAGGTRVIFESGPSGGWSTLDGFKVASGKMAESCSLQCKKTSAVASDTKTNGGLKLGLTKAELLSLFGQPTKVDKNRYMFEWSSKRAMTEAELAKFKQPVEDAYWSVDDTVEVQLSDSRVIEFEVHHTVLD